MRTLLFLLLCPFLTLQAAEIPEERAEMARLQIYLDQQNFGPGVIDGKIGTYTRKAIEAYNKKFGRIDEDMSQIKAEATEQVPDIYATAIVPAVAKKLVDSHFKWGSDRVYQSKRKDMPYRSIAEFMAERYHTSIDFLKLINGNSAVNNATIRSALLVPNVTPFHIEKLAEGRSYKKQPILSDRWAVIDTKQFQIRIYEPISTPQAPETNEEPASEVSPAIKVIAEDLTSDTPSPDKVRVAVNELSTEAAFSNEPLAPARAMIVEDDEPEQALTPYDEHRAIIVAAYPITRGKPKFIRYGTWKMLNSVEFPTWRFDDSLLKTGKRGKKSLLIPSGPNNPVGVHWMGLSRRGIGIHGTDSPDRIGRGLSSGCIRMANWDVVKLPTLIRPGATVIIK